MSSKKNKPVTLASFMQAAKELSGVSSPGDPKKKPTNTKSKSKPDQKKKKKKKVKPSSEEIPDEKVPERSGGSSSKNPSRSTEQPVLSPPASGSASKPSKGSSSKSKKDTTSGERQAKSRAEDAPRKRKSSKHKHKSKHKSHQHHRSRQRRTEEDLEHQDLHQHPQELHPDEIEDVPQPDSYPRGAKPPQDQVPEDEIVPPEGYPAGPPANPANDHDVDEFAHHQPLEGEYDDAGHAQQHQNTVDLHPTGQFVHEDGQVAQHPQLVDHGEGGNPRLKKNKSSSRHRRNRHGRHGGHGEHSEAESGGDDGGSEDVEREERRRRRKSKKRGKKGHRDRDDRGEHRDRGVHHQPQGEFREHRSRGLSRRYQDEPLFALNRVQPIPVPLGHPVAQHSDHAHSQVMAAHHQQQQQQQMMAIEREAHMRAMQHEEQMRHQTNLYHHHHQYAAQHHHESNMRRRRSRSRPEEHYADGALGRRRSRRSRRHRHRHDYEHYDAENNGNRDESSGDDPLGLREDYGQPEKRSDGSGEGMLDKIKSKAKEVAEGALDKVRGDNDSDDDNDRVRERGIDNNSGSKRSRKSGSAHSRHDDDDDNTALVNEEVIPEPDEVDGSDCTAPSGGEASPHEEEREHRRRKSREQHRRHHRKHHHRTRDGELKKGHSGHRRRKHDDDADGLYHGRGHRSHGHRGALSDAETLDSLASKRAMEVMKGAPKSPTVTLNVLERFLPARTVPEARGATNRAGEHGFLELPEVGENESLAEDALMREVRSSAFRVEVPQNFAYIIERWGKYKRRIDAGWHGLIPFVDRVHAVHSLKEDSMVLPQNQAFTRDSVPVHTAGVLFVRVTDPVAATYAVENPYRALLLLAQACIANAVGKRKLRDAIECRPDLGKVIIEEVNESAHVWGLVVSRLEVTELLPPPETRAMLQLEAEAQLQSGIERAAMEEREAEAAHDIAMQREADVQAQEELANLYESHNQATAAHTVESLSQGSAVNDHVQVDDDHVSYGSMQREDTRLSLDSSKRPPKSETETYDSFLDDNVTEHKVLGASWFTGATANTRRQQPGAPAATPAHSIPQVPGVSGSKPPLPTAPGASLPSKNMYPPSSIVDHSGASVPIEAVLTHTQTAQTHSQGTQEVHAKTGTNLTNVTWSDQDGLLPPNQQDVGKASASASYPGIV